MNALAFICFAGRRLRPLGHPYVEIARSRPVSRVLSRTVIPLGRPLLDGSCHLPAGSASRVIACCLVLLRVQIAAFHSGLNRLVSVALMRALRRTGVTRHPALWSPDFPLQREAAATIRPTSNSWRRARDSNSRCKVI